MKINAFYALFGFVALAVWIKPDPQRASVHQHPAPAAAAGSPTRLGVAQAIYKPSGEASLSRAADGHFYGEVSVNDTNAHMLVDTGASVVALTGADAERAGIIWRPEDIQPVAEGANGAVSGVRVKLERVQLGDIEVRGVDAIVVPEGLAISLLGQSFLSRAGDIQISGDKMVLGQ